MRGLRREPASDLRPVLVLLGPTGSGKSDLALALALSLGGEVVGADALQVYRGLELATGALPPGERRGVPHHLIGFLDPREEYSLGRYVRDAERAIAEIRARGRVPIVAGGTGMYLRGLLRGVFAGPARDEALRARLRAVARRGGLPRLHALLRRADPALAERVAPGDLLRISRGLEVLRRTGRPLSSLQTEWEDPAPRFPAVLLGLRVRRAVLRERIGRRVARMWEEGLPREVGALLSAGVPREANALRAIGVRDVAAALAGEIPAAEARTRMIAATRRYAKRQETWFRREPGVRWLDGELPPEALLREAAEAWRSTAGAVVDCGPAETRSPGESR